MSKLKIDHLDYEEVIYTDEHWDLLLKLRNKASKILFYLNKLSEASFCYGSVARGDVSESSDLDFFIPTLRASYQYRLVVDKMNEDIISRSIVMATPNSVIKGSYELPNEITITFPLNEFTEKDLDFYKFGGKVTRRDIIDKIRVPGINKNLELIYPTPEGHKKLDIMDMPKKDLLRLDFPQHIIEERIRVLKRREKKGRTGVFLNEKLDKKENFESKLKEIIDSNPLVKKHFRRK